ncbi:TIGR03792 family protein [Okeania sp.]|uniref:TIGR03792 family protein n=1 Tax=Okeania sp. TaxID=3100323 RepID=UPI002B4B43C6|nr:TIGR03792 family protein [Okeania sp.]MEB3342528.1 TIGR03792 family protein [Okeania sp.]
MIIEWLQFKIEESVKKEFIQKDGEIWTSFLALQTGFLKKEVWFNSDKSDEIIIIVYWENREKWKSISQVLLAQTELKFREALGVENYSLLSSKEYELDTTYPQGPYLLSVIRE